MGDLKIESFSDFASSNLNLYDRQKFQKFQIFTQQKTFQTRDHVTITQLSSSSFFKKYLIYQNFSTASTSLLTFFRFPIIWISPKFQWRKFTFFFINDDDDRSHSFTDWVIFGPTLHLTLLQLMSLKQSNTNITWSHWR